MKKLIALLTVFAMLVPFVPAVAANDTPARPTVETLNEAGYEAYNVTADNYDTLEDQLQTDFAEMGLDPNGSYKRCYS